jgi:hypothetical protein
VTLKACTVVVHDLNDTAHALDVTAEALYEAVAQALAAAPGLEWVGDIGGGLTKVTVKVPNPKIPHIVKIQDPENRLNRGRKNPKEMAMKVRLSQMLGMGGLPTPLLSEILSSSFLRSSFSPHFKPFIPSCSKPIAETALSAVKGKLSPATNRLPCDCSGRSAQHLSTTRE